MSVTDKVKSRGNVRGIVLLATILFLVFTVYPPTCIYADEPGIVIDLESISGESEKEGNVLSQYGFAVFTDESMSRMKKIKDNKESKQKRMVSGLFSSDWQGTGTYDKEVQETINEGNLFANVNTGEESTANKRTAGALPNKMIDTFALGITMCLISVAVIRWRRKKHENSHNDSAR